MKPEEMLGWNGIPAHDVAIPNKYNDFSFLWIFRRNWNMFHIISFILPKIEIYKGVNTILGPQRIIMKSEAKNSFLEF